jgi:hypothetical protein
VKSDGIETEVHTYGVRLEKYTLKLQKFRRRMG